MHSSRILAFLIAVLTFAAALPVDAAAKGKQNNNNNRNGNRQPRTVKVDASISEYVIESIGKNSITIRNEKEKRIYSITEETQVVIARLTSSVAKLQKGMKVTVLPSLLDPHAARTISVEDNSISLGKSGDEKDAKDGGNSKNPQGNKKPSGAKKK